MYGLDAISQKRFNVPVPCLVINKNLEINLENEKATCWLIHDTDIVNYLFTCRMLIMYLLMCKREILGVLKVKILLKLLRFLPCKRGTYFL